MAVNLKDDLGVDLTILPTVDRDSLYALESLDLFKKAVASATAVYTEAAYSSPMSKAVKISYDEKTESVVVKVVTLRPQHDHE